MNRQQRRAGGPGAPADVASLLMAARQAEQRRDLAGAEAALRQALTLAPGDASILRQLGLLNHRLGRDAQACRCLEQSLAAHPTAETWLLLCGLLTATGKAEPAMRACMAALALEPGLPAAHLELAGLLVAAGDFVGAAAALRQALAMRPGWFEAEMALGSALFRQGRVEEALVWHQAGLARRPLHAPAHHVIAATWRALGDTKAAFAAYGRATELAPDFAEAHRDLALMRLWQGDFAAGWRGYEARLAAAERGAPPLPSPRWDGGPFDGRTLLLHFEQGLGDTIQFLRFVPFAAARGGRTVLCVPRGLIALAESLPGVGSVIAHGAKLPRHDLHAYLLSLPHLLGTGAYLLGGSVPYLRVPESRRARAQIPADGRLRVALVRAGNPAHVNDRARSIDPGLLAPLAARTDTRWFGIQPGLPAPDFATDLGPGLADFADTAAVLGQLDLLISVDTAPAHLAGALGRPVWTLLPHVADWRWGGGDTTAWYPSMRLFRQQRRDDWDSVVSELGHALDAFNRVR